MRRAWGVALLVFGGCAAGTDSARPNGTAWGGEDGAGTPGASTGEGEDAATASSGLETDDEGGSFTDEGGEPPDDPADDGSDGGADVDTDGGGGNPSDFPPVGSFADPGPYTVVTSYNDGPGSAFALFYPSELGSTGLHHPIVTWGNGTGAIPSYYSGLLEHLASHGFVVVASNSTQTGSGAQMLEGLDWLVSENSGAASVFYDALDPTAVATIGHSQGGGGAINAGADPRVVTVVPIQPAPGDVGDLSGTMFVMSGGTDSIVSAGLVESLVYNPATVPTFYGNLLAAGHFEPVGDGGQYRGPITAWLRMELMGDETADATFFGGACLLCVDSSWDISRKEL